MYLVRSALIAFVATFPTPLLAQTPKPPVAPAVAAQSTGLKFVLRRSFQTASLFQETISGKGAEFSITRNGLTGSEVYNWKGALILGWRRDLEGVALTRFAYSLGLFGDIRDGSGVEIEDRVNKLGVGLGMAWVQSANHPLSLIKHALLETDANWLSDTQGDLSVIKSSARYRPFLTGSPQNAFALTKAGNQQRWSPSLSADYFKVIDDAGLKEYSGSSEYLYVGAGLEYDFHLKDKLAGKMGLKLSAKYHLQYDVIGDGKTSEYFEIGVNKPLTKGEGIALVVNYKKGQRLIGKGEVDRVHMGLSFKF